jgi:hypothetical protein
MVVPVEFLHVYAAMRLRVQANIEMLLAIYALASACAGRAAASAGQGPDITRMS